MTKRRVPENAKKKPAARRGRPSKDNGTPKEAGRRKVAAKSQRPKGGDGVPDAVETPPPMPKTKLKPEELDSFKHILLEKRRQLVGDVGNMENEALRKSRTDAAGDLSMMPIHMADIGTDAYEQEFTIGLIENNNEVLQEIDAALERIQNQTYGICEATHKPIRKTRLKAKPWARFCVEYKRSQEENGR